jgi:hypothetical protein
MEALLSGTYVCAFCFQINEVEVDIGAGLKQSLVEDCMVCCRPNALHILVDETSGEVLIDVDRES